MFGDLLKVYGRDHVAPLAIARWPESQEEPAVRWGLGVLHETATVIDWDNIESREAFMADRVRIATTGP